MPNRGLTWGERQAAKRRQETIEEERAQTIFENGARITSSPEPVSLTWSQKQDLARQEEEAKERVRIQEAELAAHERQIRELEEKVRKEQEAWRLKFVVKRKPSMSGRWPKLD